MQIFFYYFSLVDYKYRISLKKSSEKRKLYTQVRGEYFKASEQKYKEGDGPFLSWETSNRAELMIFTDRQQCYKTRLSDFDDSKASVLGDYLPTKLGMDAEELDREINLKLAQKILSPMEKAQFDVAEDKRLALLTFWVLKEAEAKRTGEGLRGYPNHTDFSLDDPRVTQMDGCIVAVLEGE